MGPPDVFFPPEYEGRWTTERLVSAMSSVTGNRRGFWSLVRGDQGLGERAGVMVLLHALL